MTWLIWTLAIIGGLIAAPVVAFVVLWLALVLAEKISKGVEQ